MGLHEAPWGPMGLHGAPWASMWLHGGPGPSILETRMLATSIRMQHPKNRLAPGLSYKPDWIASYRAQRALLAYEGEWEENKGAPWSIHGGLLGPPWSPKPASLGVHFLQEHLVINMLVIVKKRVVYATC